jgi:hypothetical protein
MIVRLTLKVAILTFLIGMEHTSQIVSIERSRINTTHLTHIITVCSSSTRQSGGSQQRAAPHFVFNRRAALHAGSGSRVQR